jgi:hypothetical protein
VIILELTMEQVVEKRKYRRLHFSWPVWYAENFGGILNQGQMQDVSSIGMAFNCPSNDACPYPGQNITIRFCLPKYEADDTFGIEDFVRSAIVRKVENVNPRQHRVSLNFFEPLPYDPASQDGVEDSELGINAETVL